MPIELRPYQREALANIHKDLGTHRSTLVTMATGLGKTTLFAAAIADRNVIGRTLVVAHREELIEQAARRIREQTGLSVCVEMGESSASMANPSRVVVASVQTLQRKARRVKFKPDAFHTIVIDEAHHSVAKGYRDIIDHFPYASVLGVTATPDRTDEVALGEVFDACAYRYDIKEAIDDGWLVPIVQGRVTCDSLDLSRVRKRGGDLSEIDLQEVMTLEKSLHEMAGPLIEKAGARKTIVFCAGVQAAHALAKVLSGYTKAGIEAVDGGTPKDERKAMLARFASGETQFLLNCQVLTEGFDSPGVSCIAMARPTTSRSLYAQCIGRGLRLADGKSDCLVLDFCGNAGKHNLICPHDVLAGETLPPDVKELASEIAAKRGGRVDGAVDEAKRQIDDEKARQEALKEARKRAREQRARVYAEARYKWEEVSPFKGTPLQKEVRRRGQFESDATSQQKALLKKWGMKDSELDGMGTWQASKAVKTLAARRKAGQATYAQARILTRKGYSADVSFAEANNIISKIAEREGWGKSRKAG